MIDSTLVIESPDETLAIEGDDATLLVGEAWVDVLTPGTGSGSGLGEWDEAITYQPGSFVVFNNAIWETGEETTGEEPGSGGDPWGIAVGFPQNTPTAADVSADDESHRPLDGGNVQLQLDRADSLLRFLNPGGTVFTVAKSPTVAYNPDAIYYPGDASQAFDAGQAATFLVVCVDVPGPPEDGVTGEDPFDSDYWVPWCLQVASAPALLRGTDIGNLDTGDGYAAPIGSEMQQQSADGQTADLWFKFGPTDTDWRVISDEASATGTVQSVNEIGPDGDGNIELTANDVGATDIGAVTSYVGGAIDDLNLGTAAQANVEDFDEAGAADAKVADAITDGVTTVAPSQNAVFDALTLKQSVSGKGVANGYAELDGAGLVPTAQLPSYVDDVVAVANFAALPGTGETGKIYVTIDTNLTYRWSGSAYVEISASLALGETSGTAYRGDRGKTAFDHSQLTSGNPHNVTKSDVGLGNVDNVADASKPVSTAQAAADTAVANAAVAKALFDANTILIATADNTPLALTVGASTFVGRKASGDISAMSVAEAKALLNLKMSPFTLHPLGSSMPATLGATLDVRPGGSTPAEGYPVLDFDGAAIEYADWIVTLPANYLGGGLTLDVQWAATTGTTNAVVWGAAIRRLNAGSEDLDTSQTYDYNDAAASNAPGTNGQLAVATITFTSGSDMDSWAAGEAAVIRVRRNATDAGDTMSGSDAELLVVTVRET